VPRRCDRNTSRNYCNVDRVVRVDAARSRLELLMPDASTIPLPAGEQPSPDTLASKLSGLKSGAYTIRWQLLAPDGHISRGEIPFTVKNP
jgi:methionine-rich copper-binding protein CopC